MAIPVTIPINKTAEIISTIDDRDMVQMGAYYLYLEKPKVDWGAARVGAEMHCLETRGMTRAEPVGPTRHECQTQMSDGSCARYAIIGDYQCLP